MTPYTRLAILIVVFVAVVLVALIVATTISMRQRKRTRLTVQGTITSLSRSAQLRRDVDDRLWARLLIAIERSGLSLEDTKQTQIAENLAAAGFTSPSAPRIFTLLRLISALLFPGIILLIMVSGEGAQSWTTLYFSAAVAGLFGLYAPNLFVSARADRRRTALVNGFPDALDLILICVESGLGMDAAFDRVGRELAVSNPQLAELLGSVVLELRAGRSREDTLERMAARAGVEEFRSFATLLIQSAQLGTSVGQALRTYAAEMREKRKMRAEEKAHKIPVLVSMPLVGCMLPVIVGVLMLPALIRVVREMLPALGGE
jgi:tight adherence protein C